jgi:hypothetical protein
MSHALTLSLSTVSESDRRANTSPTAVPFTSNLACVSPINCSHAEATPETEEMLKFF